MINNLMDRFDQMRVSIDIGVDLIPTRDTYFVRIQTITPDRGSRVRVIFIYVNSCISIL